MRFRWKIFTLCFATYIITLAFTAFFVSRRSYSNLLKNEVKRSQEEERNVHSSVVLYLLGGQKNDEERLSINVYSKRIVEVFSSKTNYMDIFTGDGEPLASSSPVKNPISGKSLQKALSEERSYLLSHINGEYYLFVYSTFTFNNSKFLMSYVKNITHLEQQRISLYASFLWGGLLGLILIAILSAVISKLIVNPIDQMIGAAREITAGNYNKTVEISTEDEIGELSGQFNVMVIEINKRILELEAESERKQRFMDNLTHELRTPLTSIIGYSDLLKGIKYDEATFSKGLGFISSEGKRMLRLINSLMELILVRENKPVLENAPVLPLLKEVADILSVKAGEKNITLTISGEDFTLDYDRDLLKGALLNLVENSIKYSDTGKKVFLGLKHDNTSGMREIYVMDQGKGMESEELARIFEPFYRVDKSRSRKDGGLGLGLAIVKAAAEAHGAGLLVESATDMGTLITIKFTERSGG